MLISQGWPAGQLGRALCLASQQKLSPTWWEHWLPMSWDHSLASHAGLTHVYV